MLDMLLNTGIIRTGIKPSEYVLRQTNENTGKSIIWTAPDDVWLICCVCVGWGLVGGGGLSWRNDIPVRPGQSLTLTFTNEVSTANSTKSAGSTNLRRGSTLLCIANHSGWMQSGGTGYVIGGLGGKEANAVNDGGGNGGRGYQINRTGFPGADTMIGGGAGGYLGDGGSGATDATTDTAGQASSGSGSGARGYSPPATTTRRRRGGDVGLYGVGNTGLTAEMNAYAEGNPGSVAEVMCGGGGRTPGEVAQNGGIRIIWGDGVSFPYNAGLD